MVRSRGRIPSETARIVYEHMFAESSPTLVSGSAARDEAAMYRVAPRGHDSDDDMSHDNVMAAPAGP